MGIGLEFDQIVKYIALLMVLYVVGSIILRYMHIPAKLIALLISNSLMGLGMIILINALLVNFGINLPINPFNLVFAAFFGLPGVVCLLVLKFIL